MRQHVGFQRSTDATEVIAKADERRRTRRTRRGNIKCAGPRKTANATLETYQGNKKLRPEKKTWKGSTLSVRFTTVQRQRVLSRCCCHVVACVSFVLELLLRTNVFSCLAQSILYPFPLNNNQNKENKFATDVAWRTEARPKAMNTLLFARTCVKR